jgi:fumarate hydratase subunit beta
MVKKGAVVKRSAAAAKQPVQLKTPLGAEVLQLRAGDRVELSGIVYTARDEAHLRMQKDGIPFDPEGAVIYHCGPVIADNRVIAAGPTTSARMNEMEGFLLDKGVRAFIGKGGMGATVRNQLKGRGVYFAFTGGCAALASSHMQLKGVFYEDLGMAEAVWVIELNRLPLVVGIDAQGNDIFEAARTHAKEAFREYSARPHRMGQ